MKIRMTFEFDDYDRAVVASSYGDPGKAGRKDLLAWIKGVVDAAFNQHRRAYRQGEEEEDGEEEDDGKQGEDDGGRSHRIRHGC